LRPLLVLSFAIPALVAAAPASSGLLLSERVAGSESVSLQRGRGYAVIAKRGAVIGNVGRGWVRVAHLPDGPSPEGYVRGCEARSGRLAEKLYCRGRALRLYVHGGTWRIRMRGRAINVSGVVRGSLGLDRDSCSLCHYRIGPADPRRWPATLTFFTVRS